MPNLFMVRKKWLILMVTEYQVGVMSHPHGEAATLSLCMANSVRFRISLGVFDMRKTRTENIKIGFIYPSVPDISPITIRMAARLPAFLVEFDLLLTEERLFCLILV